MPKCTMWWFVRSYAVLAFRIFEGYGVVHWVGLTLALFSANAAGKGGCLQL